MSFTEDIPRRFSGTPGFAQPSPPRLPSIRKPAAFQAFAGRRLQDIPQLALLPPETVAKIRLATLVFPFKVNSYVLDNLIDWAAAPDDPMFRLVFPHADMLQPDDRADLTALVDGNAPSTEIAAAVVRIRARMNPHSSDQIANVPLFGGDDLQGVQHKYRETVLFFPKKGQTCHSYCSFCFRWPQFLVGDTPKFGSNDTDLLHSYLRQHEDVSDLLLTGGDPLVMDAQRLASYLLPLLSPDFAHVETIRIGTKALTYWPQRFLSEPDSDELLDLIRTLVDGGKQVAIMAHLNHWREMTPEPFQEALDRLRRAGAVVRSQSPILRHINDDAGVWRRLWTDQVRLGISPYYMFVERDTGASHYFGLPLARALEIYQDACSQLSGLAKTARGPVMSAGPGKVHVLGKIAIAGRPHFILSFLQARRKEWLYRPFLAEYSSDARWLDDLRPADGSGSFFFEDEYRNFLAGKRHGATAT